MTPEEIEESRATTVSEHATRMSALSYKAQIGDHDIMEAQTTTIANAEPAPAPDSRQVMRAKKRAAEKARRKHMNEAVGGKNRKRGR
jgi:hypothetical protein